MLDILPNDSASDQPIVIEFDATSAVLEIFIEWVYSNDWEGSTLTRNGFLELVQLLHVLDKLQCASEICQRLRAHIRSRNSMEPWTAFVYASQQRNQVMAKRAILHFGDDPCCPPSRLPHYNQEEWLDVPSGWRKELQRLRVVQRAAQGDPPTKRRSLRFPCGLCWKSWSIETEIEDFWLRPWSEVSRDFWPSAGSKESSVISLPSLIWPR